MLIQSTLLTNEYQIRSSLVKIVYSLATTSLEKIIKMCKSE